MGEHYQEYSMLWEKRIVGMGRFLLEGVMYSPRVTTITGMLSRWRVAWDSRRKPYSREYSTIYSSWGHTTQKQTL